MAYNLDNVFTYLEGYEPKLIKATKQILTRAKRNASYRLYNSFFFLVNKIRNGIGIEFKYAKHGAFVLDSKRNVVKQGPSKKGGQSAINSIKRWFLSKGISIGGGRTRSVTGQSKVQTKQTPDKRLTSMAYAIWFSIKKRGKLNPTFSRDVNFLKPYQNLSKNPQFISGLGKAFKKDTLNIVNQSNKQKQYIIKIKT
jgi:hypothetical protein